MSMYRQLWLAILTSTLLALTGALLVSMLSARSYLEAQLSVKNTDNATALALSLSRSDLDPVSVELTVSATFDGGHYELISITDPYGKPVVERRARADTLASPGTPVWFAHLLPLRAAPGLAQISNGWQQFGTLTVISQSRYAYGALWSSAQRMVAALVAAGLVAGYLGTAVLRRLKRPLDSVINQASAIAERRFVTIDEPAVPELRRLAAAMNAAVLRLKAMFEDEAARLETLRRQVNFDPLTGLANREYFLARLGGTLAAEDAAGGQLWVVRLADLAGMNRRLGRSATDDFLRLCAGVFDRCVGDNAGGMAARLNGADFAIMLSGEETDARSPQRLLDDLVTLAAPFVEQRTAAIGFGRYRHGMLPGALLARIDMALAWAEADGRDTVRAADDVPDEAQPRTAEQWAGSIRQALERQWVRLGSYPVVALNGRLSHLERPLRVKLEEDGAWLPAGRFLPFAERLSLMPALDLAVVQRVLHDLQTNPAGPDQAIHLSPSSIADEVFRDRLLTLLKTHRAAAARLWFGVPEAGALQQIAAFRALCGTLRAMGCRIGLEHFGHHFSKIGLWHDLGLDFLKADASFVLELPHNSGNMTFLKGLCGIGHAMGLLVIAEGVASASEWNQLQSLGFDGGTGPGVPHPPT